MPEILRKRLSYRLENSVPGVASVLQAHAILLRLVYIKFFVNYSLKYLSDTPALLNKVFVLICYIEIRNSYNCNVYIVKKITSNNKIKTVSLKSRIS